MFCLLFWLLKLVCFVFYIFLYFYSRISKNWNSFIKQCFIKNPSSYYSYGNPVTSVGTITLHGPHSVPYSTQCHVLQGQWGSFHLWVKGNNPPLTPCVFVMLWIYKYIIGIVIAIFSLHVILWKNSIINAHRMLYQYFHWLNYQNDFTKFKDKVAKIYTRIQNLDHHSLDKW